MGENEGLLPVAIAKRASSQVDAVLSIRARGVANWGGLYLCLRCRVGKYVHGKNPTDGKYAQPRPDDACSIEQFDIRPTGHVSTGSYGNPYAYRQCGRANTWPPASTPSNAEHERGKHDQPHRRADHPGRSEQIVSHQQFVLEHTLDHRHRTDRPVLTGDVDQS